MSQTSVLSIGSLTSISILRKKRKGKATKEAYEMDPGLYFLFIGLSGSRGFQAGPLDFWSEPATQSLIPVYLLEGASDS